MPPSWSGRLAAKRSADAVAEGKIHRCPMCRLPATARMKPHAYGRLPEDEILAAPSILR
jgi:hypothetical protein